MNGVVGIPIGLNYRLSDSVIFDFSNLGMNVDSCFVDGDNAGFLHEDELLHIDIPDAGAPTPPM